MTVAWKGESAGGVQRPSHCPVFYKCLSLSRKSLTLWLSRTSKMSLFLGTLSSPPLPSFLSLRGQEVLHLFCAPQHLAYTSTPGLGPLHCPAWGLRKPRLREGSSMPRRKELTLASAGLGLMTVEARPGFATITEKLNVQPITF